MEKLKDCDICTAVAVGSAEVFIVSAPGQASDAYARFIRAQTPGKWLRVWACKDHLRQIILQGEDDKDDAEAWRPPSAASNVWGSAYIPPVIVTGTRRIPGAPGLRKGSVTPAASSPMPSQKIFSPTQGK